MNQRHGIGGQVEPLATGVICDYDFHPPDEVRLFPMPLPRPIPSPWSTHPRRRPCNRRRYSRFRVPATPAGYQQLRRLADRQEGRRVWAIEGTGGYGAGLTRFLQANAEQVVELDRPKRAALSVRLAARRSAVQAAWDAETAATAASLRAWPAASSS